MAMSSDLTIQLEKGTMAQAFLDQVDCLLSVTCHLLATNPCLAITAIFKVWLQWFKMAGSGVEWAELAMVDKECQQLYKQYKYKGGDWIWEYAKHSVPLPLLEFLLEDLEASMMVSASNVAKANNTMKHPPCKLTITMGVEHSEGCGKEGSVNYGNIGEAMPSTPKHASTVVDTDMGTGVVLKKAKENTTALLEERNTFKERQGVDGTTISSSKVIKGRQQEKS
ncbi:hypothetical protein C0989_008557 [Termitomyces sp. Mn162]|nr:hypothetical protein C0989_008557 [Termitomyces sp. Mn162]